ncbi:Acyl-CoA synthetase (AMP-forming)/AMP-acid ligase II [Prauserella marina]|uniref:Acyl-CoA synthetase (AMP-forming)/AMP-acid ligase II n=1 Tax=Prauserella marina TaxID=530584 RepID=A0A1G6W9V9_9PSEU|nr:acyl-CoA synthetase [Prauserella marina]PWV74082.1 acyl-CoA synthetase (AMP-forming)/AMP-acid ligase II [Prauserella marina]SDD62584.1 Acyl-CoA synthetase (AMP-forming)/AMP-acid ligase II [Prauserella marina]
MSAPNWRAVNLAHLLTATARRLPGRDALVHGPARLTWAELNERVDAVAAELRRRGVGRGDAVLVHSPNHVELVATMFGVWRAGAVFAPANYRLTPAEVAGLAKLTRPTALVCHADYSAHAAAVADVAGLHGGTLWLGAEPGADDALVSLPAAGPQPDEPVRDGDHAWYFFTSGTSGRPKAVVLTHDQMGFVVNNHLCDLMPGLADSDAQIVVAPLSHGAGVHLLPQVARGAKTVLPTSASLDPAEIWRLVEAERVTNAFTVPTILTALTQSPEAAARDLSSLRYVIYAGAPMYRADQERAREVLGDVLVQYYGLGEVTGNITVLPPAQHGRPSADGVEFGTCGYPRTGMQVSIQDSDGAELPVGEQGEICVAGPAVFAGYLNNDEADAASFRDGWFRTGDLGMVDGEGYVYVTGRASDMFISGGSNVYPREIEERLLRHPSIAEVAVVGVPDPKWGEIGVAVCVADGGRADDENLRSWLSETLARYKIPKRFVWWDDIPKSGYGKVVKRTIRERLEHDLAAS